MKFARRQQRAERRRPRPRRLYEVLSPIEDAEKIPFDPHRDIPLMMKDTLLRYVQGNESLQAGENSHLYVAAAAITMFPEMRQRLQLERQRDSQISKVQEHSNLIFHGGSIFSLGIDTIITCYPEAKQQLPIDSIKAALILLVDAMRDLNAWREASDAAVLLLMVDPESKDEIVLDEKMRKGLIKALQKEITDDNWIFAFRILKNFVLLFPDHKDELPLTPELWDTMRHLLKGRDRNHGSYAETAEAMAILAAQRAEIGSDGLIHITPHQPKLKKLTPLPHRTRS